jgi:hypothetical protein
MTEQPTEGTPAPPAPVHESPQPPLMPRWIPILIGVVLVLMAALAVVTGVRFRDTSLVGMVKPRKPERQFTTAAPPGEPEAGASLMFPGDSGDNAPVAHEPVTGPSHAVVTGGGRAGVTATVRLWARRGMTTHVVPGDALVYVNDVAIGQADQFNSEDEIYDFPAAGSYTIHIVAPGYRDRTFVVTAADDAKAEIAAIDVKLDKQ